MKMSYRQAIVAMAKALLWHLTDEDNGSREDVELRLSLREYIKRYEND